MKKPPLRKSKGGRPKGSKTPKTIAIQALLAQRLPDSELLDLLVSIAKGTERRVLNGRGDVVTIQDPPDGATARYLADRKWGKVPQPVNGDSDGPPVAVRLVVSSVGIPLGE